MRLNLFPLALSFLLTASSCSPIAIVVGDWDTLPATYLKPFGRTLINENHSLELIGSASHFGFRFKGKECRVYAYLSDEGAHSYLQYEVDGAYRERVRISGNKSQTILISAPGEGVHEVWVYKATEATTGPVFIEKVIGEGLRALKRPDAPLIEFIGNSITCGAAADDSGTPCGEGEYHDQHNAFFAYGPRVARALGANYLLSSVSGIGIYRNWNSEGPTMPEVYEKADLQNSSDRLWDFKQYHPVIVSIALGTNDYSDGDGGYDRGPFDPGKFTEQYTKFVQQVKSKYPKAQIALLSSPMLNGERREILQNCLTKVKEAIDAQYPTDKPVAVYFFKPMQPRGCSSHPSVEDHAVLAEELIPFFKGLLER